MLLLALACSDVRPQFGMTTEGQARAAAEARITLKTLPVLLPPYQMQAADTAEREAARSAPAKQQHPTSGISAAPTTVNVEMGFKMKIETQRRGSRHVHLRGLCL
jgi:hypothetical protein